MLALLIFSLFSCKKDELPEPFANETRTYLHLSHTRTNNNPLMVEEAEILDFNKYDMLWLGGDLAMQTSADAVTMNRADSIFNLGDANTLWALGNHDYSNLDKVQQYSNKPVYYTTHNEGITYIVLDTQDSLSNIVGAQKDLVLSVLDTIQESSHLILLHHKLIWMYDNPTLEPQISSVSNAHLDNCFYCINPNNFNTEIYPELVKVQSRGTEVLCIGGDIGFKANEFEYRSPDGIYFLASGIDFNGTNNKALLFHHDVENRSLDWEFKSLSDL